MGNYHPRPVRFIQSAADFPLTVSLGNKVPAWGLSRWHGGGGLRFIPPDDEGFALRGDNRRLVYKGRRRSHRFTILGDSSFEYDCILNREPESNVVSLGIEGASQFDFFRQPDFIQDPFLAGSYAVYKKETLLGEGTGKLCHIHRPMIIDARGRRVWGDLSIVGDKLLITIPENWLSKAAYPVIVDPTIGTTTIGSQTHWDYDPPEPWAPLTLEGELAFNQFTVAEDVKGLCAAYFYAYSDEEPDSGGYPVIYDDNGFQPVHRLTKEEQFLDLEVSRAKPAGWRNTTFKTKETIPAGTKIWFGLYTEYFAYARFDYGARFYSEWNDKYDSIPDTMRVYSGWSGTDADYYSFKVSWYFTYTSAQNYTRTLTQGVTLADTRNMAGVYKRTAAEMVMGSAVLGRFASFPRHCLETVKNSMTVKALPTFICSLVEQIRATMGLSESRGFSRNCAETVKAETETKRSQGFCRRAQDGVKGNDTVSFPVLFLRVQPETAVVVETTGHWGAYVRGLLAEAASMTETRHVGEYYRKQTETVQADGAVYRGLLIFVKLLTTSLVRDFLLRRFLKSNEDIVLKSCVCRELTLESSIH
jgi:hypothetical protein